VVPLAAQVLFENLGKAGFVFDYQNRGGHGLHFSPVGRERGKWKVESQDQKPKLRALDLGFPHRSLLIAQSFKAR
jgi:hypothetical protein